MLGTIPALILAGAGQLQLGQPLVLAPELWHFQVLSGSVNGGAAEPGFLNNDNCAGPGFATQADAAYTTFSIPACYSTSVDPTFMMHWCNQSGDALGAGETVIFIITWRSIDWEDEQVTTGTIATQTVTVTQSGAGGAAQTYETMFTLPATTGNQPLTAGDHLLIKIQRDVNTDTYSGAAIITHIKLNLYRTATCN